jgi:RNA polymerase sigma-70 factor, ECF subfamily
MATELKIGVLDERTRLDSAVFARLIDEHLGSAFALANAMLRDTHEAEDAVQEAALRAWHRFHQFQDRGQGPRSWFLAIVANQCRSRLRSRWWQVWRRPHLELGGGAGHEEQTVRRAELARAMNGLTHEQRAVLYLCYQLDLPLDEAARVLDVRVGTVKSRRHRAIAKLRVAMREEAEGDA